MAPKKVSKGKQRRTGDAMMFYERQQNYLKRKNIPKMKEARKKKDRLKYLVKKAIKQLSSKEKKELKQLQEEIKKK